MHGSQYNLLFLLGCCSQLQIAAFSRVEKLKREQLVVSVGRDSIKAAVDPSSNNDDSVRNSGRTAHSLQSQLTTMER
jgi:hypothetical protein